MAIYLDHNAGAPARPEAIAATLRMLAGAEGNPASVHRSGQRARRALEDARAQVAELIAAAPREIVFTSGCDFRCARERPKSGPRHHLGVRAFVDLGAAGRV